MGNTSPGVGKGWAEQGFTEVTPVDPSVSQGDADVMLQGNGKVDREQLDPDRYPRLHKMTRGTIKPLVHK